MQLSHLHEAAHKTQAVAQEEEIRLLLQETATRHRAACAERLVKGQAVVCPIADIERVIAI